MLRDVPWRQYEAILAAAGDRGSPRTAYLDGDLELMTPSPLHEARKTLLGRLIEAYAEEHDIELAGLGSTTFRRKATARGAEPDACYALGTFDPRNPPSAPDLAVEIAISPWRIDRFRIYEGLRVKELWLWHDDALRVFVLRPAGRYARVKKSTLFPRLDLGVLARFARRNDHTTAVREFRKTLRAR